MQTPDVRPVREAEPPAACLAVLSVDVDDRTAPLGCAALRRLRGRVESARGQASSPAWWVMASAMIMSPLFTVRAGLIDGSK